MSATSTRPELASFITALSPSDSAEAGIKRALQLIRSHLGMDIAFVSEFVGDRRVFREVIAPGNEGLIKVGDSNPLEEGYCQRVVDGRLPELMPDTSLVPAAMEMEITTALPVGAHLSVPIRLQDGRVYGTFCCFSFAPDRSLNERDLQMMRAFAELTAFEIDRDIETVRLRDEKSMRVKSVVERDQLSMVYQPIYRVEDLKIVGVECLARFSALPHRTPDVWFAEATEVGLGTQLELAAMHMALAALPSMQEDVYVAINVSPLTILSGEVARALENAPVERIVLEVTEHAQISDYDALLDALRPLRLRGLRLAIDDAGAGYASLRHILNLQPDLIKLDIGLTRSIDIDPARRALAAALLGFARETNSQIIAEGVETASELKTLQALGINNAQGYFLARPAPIASVLSLLHQDAAPNARFESKRDTDHSLRRRG
jgi:EAL domain-containing protein (putative c-di-GMP-specific phosphodiesterase class I)